MKTISLISSPSPATTHFAHPTFKTKPRFTTDHHCTLNITRPTTIHRPLKTNHPQQPDYKNPTISTPQKERNFGHQNTSSDVLRLIDNLGLIVTPDIYASLVVECTRKRDAVRAMELFAHMKRNHRMVGFLNRPSGLLMVNRILTMLVVCGCLDDAHQLFDEMPHRDSITLAIMIAVLVDEQLFDHALDLFVVMYPCFISQQSVKALQVVLVCVLEACVRVKNVGVGKVVHGWLLKMGYGRELFVSTALIEFYGKFRCLSEANSVFYEQIQMADHCDSVLWTGAIANNCRGGNFDEVVRIFQEMGNAGVSKNEYTFSYILKACGRASGDGSYGRQVHGNAIKLTLDTHVLVMCGLVDMYGRCGLLNDAKKVFGMISHDKRNRACWNAMVSGFIQHGLCIEAIKMLYHMKAAGMDPQEALIDEVRIACSAEKLNVRSNRDMQYLSNVD